MGLWSWLGWSGGPSSADNHAHQTINPASGLPMTGGGAIDIAGNPWGTDSALLASAHEWTTCRTRSLFDGGGAGATGFDPMRGW